jgi:aspartate kinase
MNMKVFKFGGASVKDANAVRNVAYILSLYNQDKVTVIISAMGKTTNAMEAIVDALWNKQKSEFEILVEERRLFHLEIINSLFGDNKNLIFSEINQIFDLLSQKINQPLSHNYNFEYDQIVSIGEIVSTKIVSAFLKEEGVKSKWADARKLIRTNNTYREGNVDWPITEKLINKDFSTAFEHFDVQITQGFIGHTSEGFTTTLGREGSDYTAGIFAYCLNADDVTIWKDVPGMLNADPKWFDNTIKLDKISFKEAIELSYYGATVIHPKTIKPLQNKGIPLYVKSFINPKAEGTIIQESTKFDYLVPSFIFKMNQLYLSITPKDFSFIVEENLSDIFKRLAELNTRINLMQNSALSFSVALDHDKIDVNTLLEKFTSSYNVKYEEGLELVTIRHYDKPTLERVLQGKKVLIEQKSENTVRVLMKNL